MSIANRRPLSVRFLATSFLALWLILAAFPFFWTPQNHPKPQPRTRTRGVLSSDSIREPLGCTFVGFK